jgi:hypothetical protein
MSKGHTFFLGQSGCVNLIPASKAIKTTSGPVGSCLSHFGIEKLPRPLRGWSGRIELIPASNVTQTTFRPVGLTISHSGVKGHPDHFWVGGTASTSFWRGRSPRLLLARSGKNKKAKKSYGAFWDSNPYLFERPALYHIDYSDLNLNIALRDTKPLRALYM